MAEDNQRYYPYGNFASYVLGHTSADSAGVAGIELKYDSVLKGTSGKLIVSTDAAGKEIPQGSEQYYEPTTGNGLVLTVDEVIQHYCEKAAQKAYEENNASKKFDELISKGIEVAKIKLTINGENNEDKKCIEVMDGVFTILNKLDEDGVKSIKTADFKKWTQNIINKEDLNNSKKLNLINECINNFPEEINKNNKGEISANVYKAINEN